MTIRFFGFFFRVSLLFVTLMPLHSAACTTFSCRWILCFLRLNRIFAYFSSVFQLITYNRVSMTEYFSACSFFAIPCVNGAPIFKGMASRIFLSSRTCSKSPLLERDMYRWSRDMLELRVRVVPSGWRGVRPVLLRTKAQTRQMISRHRRHILTCIHRGNAVVLGGTEKSGSPGAVWY